MISNLPFKVIFPCTSRPFPLFLDFLHEFEFGLNLFLIILKRTNGGKCISQTHRCSSASLLSCLSIRSNQSRHFPLTCGINKASLPRELLLPVYFLLFGLYSVRQKPQQVSSPWSTQTSLSGTANHVIFKVTEIFSTLALSWTSAGRGHTYIHTEL